jgi:surface carbohydrate biosynthesis protein (TIGR04326 family)
VSDNILIWDLVEEPKYDKYKLIMWQDVCPSVENFVSIPKLVEENSIQLRSRYLAWIYDLGESRVKGKSLVDALEVSPGLSFWWMTLLAEKCNMASSPHITDALKLMAFELWAKNNAIDTLTLCGDKKPLAECLRLWCKDNNVQFVHRDKELKSTFNFSVRKLYDAMPYPLQALSYFCRYIIKRWCLRGVGLKQWKRSTGTITFFSYLLNLNRTQISVGNFESNYWANLPDELRNKNIETNWLHQYVEHTTTATPKAARAVIESFNNRSDSKQVHVMLETFLSLKIVLASLCGWAKLILLARNTESHLSAVKSGELNLWPMHRDDWRKSIYGSRPLIQNVTYLLLRSAMQTVPTQSLGIYLYEQQAWELTLIHCWKNLGHSHLMGSQHTAMLFWNLRYYHDRRSYYSTDFNSLPMPNSVAINGLAAKNICLEADYPPQKLVELEALRYLGLKYCAKDSFRQNWHSGLPIRLLVLTEYYSEITHIQMKLVEGVANIIKEELTVLVKPHPNFLVQSDHYGSLDFKVTMEAIPNLLENCDVVFCGALTSAAIDIYSAGLPLVCFKDVHTLNLSPLRGLDNVRFCSTSAELATQMIDALMMGGKENVGEQFFTIDAKLPRWIAEVERHLTTKSIQRSTEN